MNQYKLSCVAGERDSGERILFRKVTIACFGLAKMFPDDSWVKNFAQQRENYSFFCSTTNKMTHFSRGKIERKFWRKNVDFRFPMRMRTWQIAADFAVGQFGVGTVTAMVAICSHHTYHRRPLTDVLYNLSEIFRVGKLGPVVVFIQQGDVNL